MKQAEDFQYKIKNLTRRKSKSLNIKTVHRNSPCGINNLGIQTRSSSKTV